MFYLNLVSGSQLSESGHRIMSAKLAQQKQKLHVYKGLDDLCKGVAGLDPDTAVDKINQKRTNIMDAQTEADVCGVGTSDFH